MSNEVSKEPGIIAEVAHIVGFKKTAARGSDPARARLEDINDPGNLMVLCTGCHDEIDIKNPSRYTVAQLREFKKRHEKRISELTATPERNRVSVITLRARIHRNVPSLSFPEVAEAIRPKYVFQSDLDEINLTGLSDDLPGFYDLAKREIDERVATFLKTVSDRQEQQDIAVFGIAPIPLLIALGAALDDKRSVDIFCRHRATESWQWRTGLPTQTFVFRRVIDGLRSPEVAIWLSLSGAVCMDESPESLRSLPTYEITLDPGPPAPGEAIRSKDDLQRFRVEYTRLIGTIQKEHPGVRKLHLCPAIPTSAAISIGQARLVTSHPQLVVYDKVDGQFVHVLEIGTLR